MGWEEFIAKNPDRVKSPVSYGKIQSHSHIPKTGEVKNTAKLGHKFRAKRTVRDGFNFDSKLEASYYDYLKLLENEGEVVFFLRQTRFHLEGNVTYAVDFQVFWSDGSVTFVDVKGKETKEFIRAKKQVEARYPIDITVVKKGDF